MASGRLTKREPAQADHSLALRNIFFGIVFLALVLGTYAAVADPMVQLGLIYHGNISSWFDCTWMDCTLFRVKLIFSPVELGIVFVAGAWVVRERARHRPVRLDLGSLFAPLAVFVVCLVIGVGRGMLAGGGNLTIAEWEIRGFGMMVLVYLVSGLFVRTERDLNALVWVVLIASTALAIANFLRWFIVLRRTEPGDLTYDHIDSVVMVFAFVLGVCLILFGGTRRQRIYAVFLLPVLFITMSVMQRRAAFAILAAGLVAVVVLVFRLRPRLFWVYVLPGAILVALYLVIFWNDSSTLGQPARAVSSMFVPDARDYASNIYRAIEKYDIIQNIQTSPILGLGFGQQYTFFIPLPDLSWWPFWRYTPHNNILWVWLKDGAIGFFAFFWLLGRAAYDGAMALDAQREYWQLSKLLQRRFGRASIGLGERTAQGTPPTPKRRGGRRRPKPTTAEHTFRLRMLTVRWDVPMWERSERRTSRTSRPTGAAAFVAATISLIPIQVMYSYVDLGLTSERDMLLLGLALGILARAYVPFGDYVRRAHKRRDSIPSLTYSVPAAEREATGDYAGVGIER